MLLPPIFFAWKGREERKRRRRRKEEEELHCSVAETKRNAKKSKPDLPEKANQQCVVRALFERILEIFLLLLYLHYALPVSRDAILVAFFVDYCFFYLPSVQTFQPKKID